MAKLTHCFGTSHTSKSGILWFQRDHKLKMALTMKPIFGLQNRCLQWVMSRWSVHLYLQSTILMFGLICHICPDLLRVSSHWGAFPWHCRCYHEQDSFITGNFCELIYDGGCALWTQYFQFNISGQKFLIERGAKNGIKGYPPLPWLLCKFWDVQRYHLHKLKTLHFSLNWLHCKEIWLIHSDCDREEVGLKKTLSIFSFSLRVISSF